MASSSAPATPALSENEPRPAERSARGVAERRKFDRTPLALHGRIYCGVRNGECVVTDLSPAGARLRIAGVFEVATIITVKIDRFASFHARVVWRRGEEHGVKFLDDPRRIAQLFASVL